MGCCQSVHNPKEEDDEQGEQPIDIRFSNTSADGDERETRSTVRPSRARASGDFAGPPVFSGRYGSSRGAPSPSLSSVSLVPVARTGSYDVRVASRTRQNGGDGVIETSRLVIDHLKGNVFINQYLIIKDLGKGAHGTVKLVYNTQDDMLYAMKVIHKRRMRRQSYLAEPRAVANMMRNVGMSSLAQSQTDGQRGSSPVASPRTPTGMTDEYSNEIAVMKELDHPNVVKLYEVIHDPSNNKLLMTMEYVEGGCVLAGSSPTQKVPIPESTAVKYFRDVVKGLEYLHFNRIVHGDLKPDNLLMSSSGKVKISDFGSARFCEKSDMIFATAGTPSFMAPEMCQGKQFNGFPGDIWALGICLYMFVFGKPPFTGTTTYQIYENIQNAELQFPPEIPVSEELKDLLRRLLQKDPSERISLEEIPAHPWVTRGGALPVLQTSNERAVQRVFEAMRKRNESGAKRPAPSTVLLAAPPEPVDMRNLVPDAEVRHFKDGEVIITQGQLPEGLYYVQDGFVDMMLMPSEKKLVADEDFADAIDDEEDDEEDEAVVTATANALDCRRSPGSGVIGEGGDGSGDEDGQDGEEEDGDDVQKGMDGFMALFGSRLSDRVSPLGSSPTVTPRNHSAAVTPRHGSQTLAPRNHSTILPPRYASQSLGARRTSRAFSETPARTYSHASASLPLPAALTPHRSMPAPGGTPHLHPHPPPPHHLAHLLPPGSSRTNSRHHSRTPSHTNSTPAANSAGGSSSVVLSPRNNSQSASPRGTPPPGNSSGGGIAGGVAGGVTLSGMSALGRRPSYNGGVLPARLPSYTNMAGAGPSPLGLSCSNAADVLEKELPGHEGAQGGHATANEPDAPPMVAAGQFQSPFMVPSPPHTSPQPSRRQLTQEPSFNPRSSRHESGLKRGPSRLSGADASQSILAGSAPGRMALLGRAASNRAARHSMDSEDSAAQPEPYARNNDPLHAGSGGRRSGSHLGPHASSSATQLHSVSAGGAPAAPHLSFQTRVPLPSMPTQQQASPSPVQKGKGKGKEKEHEEDLLFLSPTESRRLSVTAGGAASFRRLGGAGVIVGSAATPSGPPGSISPAQSVSRVHSAESGNRPAPGLTPAFEDIVAEGSGESGKPGSNDSIISNADISMHTPARAGWRRERPAPLQVGGGALPGGVIEPMSPAGGHHGGSAAGSAGGTSGGSATGVRGPAPPSPSMSPAHPVGHVRLRGNMRRSVTLDDISDPVKRDRSRGSPGGGAVMTSAGGRPDGHDAARGEDAEEEEDEEQDGYAVGHGEQQHHHPQHHAEASGAPGMRHAYTSMDRTSPEVGAGQPGYADERYASAQPLRPFMTPLDRALRADRVRRHSTSSYNATTMLTRILGASTGGGPLDRSSIQEWSSTSKLAQKAIQRSDSMHSRMAQMVLRAKQHAVRRKRRGSMQLVTTRGPGSVVGELCIDGKPNPSPSTVVAKGPVTVLLIKNEKVNKYRNQPSVMAALHRSQNASLVQEAMERFVECEQEVVAVEVIRRTITTEPNMHLEMGHPDDYTGEHQSSERLMADIYNA